MWCCTSIWFGRRGRLVVVYAHGLAACFGPNVCKNGWNSASNWMLLKTLTVLNKLLYLAYLSVLEISVETFLLMKNGNTLRLCSAPNELWNIPRKRNSKKNRNFEIHSRSSVLLMWDQMGVNQHLMLLLV